MALVCFLNGSLAREAVCKEYDLDWEHFTQALRETRPGNKNALMLPYFAPEIVPKVPSPNVVRHQLAANDTAANVRAVIEAQALSSKIHARWMGIEISSLYVTGGASANSEILRVYADVHNCPVHRFETTNSAALGAALRAAYAEQKNSGDGSSWQAVVEGFTQPVAGTTIDPDGRAVTSDEKSVGQYEKFEKEHTAI